MKTTYEVLFRNSAGLVQNRCTVETRETNEVLAKESAVRWACKVHPDWDEKCEQVFARPISPKRHSGLKAHH